MPVGPVDRDIPDDVFVRRLGIVRARLRMASEPEVVARLIADADNAQEAGRALAEYFGGISAEDAANQLVDARFRILLREEVRRSESEQEGIQDHLRRRGYPLNSDS